MLSRQPSRGTVLLLGKNQAEEPSPCLVSAVLLAAGLSERMGKDKLMLDFNGKSILQHSVDILHEIPVFERILITTEARLNQIIIQDNVQVIINHQPGKGKCESIRLGVEAASGTHFLFLQADQPMLTLKDITSLLDAASENVDKIIYPIVNNQPCSPTIFPAKFRNKLLSLTGDTGGNIIRKEYIKDCLGVNVLNTLNFMDINTMEDYSSVARG